MAFRKPALNLTCNIFQAQGGGPAPPTAATQQAIPCQLRFPRPAPLLATSSIGSSYIMLLILPKGTDIRGGHPNNVPPDAVEVPAGTGRFYKVLAVDDSARGSPNETRRASIATPSNLPGWWPYPTP